MRQLILAVIGLYWCTLSAFAQSASSIELDGLSIQLSTAWPGSVNTGYQPLRIQVQSRLEVADVVSFEIVSDFGKQFRLDQSVAIQPGETLSFEVLVPAFLPRSREFRVHVEAAGQEGDSTTLGATRSGGSYVHSVALFSGASVVAGRDEKWSQLLSPDPTKAGHRNWLSEHREFGLHSASVWESDGSVVVLDIPFDGMSTDWRAYTSLDVVIVDLSGGLPGTKHMDALIAWTRAGGEVVFAGSDANAQLAKVDALQACLENRFLLESPADYDLVRRYQCGFGRLLVAPTSSLLDDENLQAVVLAEMRSSIRTQWTPSFRGSRGAAQGFDPRVPGLADMPYRFFVGFIILFGVMIWPLNFYLVKRLGKPVWLLVTIPAIAFCSSIVVLGYGLFGQGLEVKVDSTSVAVLDQRSGTVSNFEARGLFAGLAPGRGQVLGAGTALFLWDSPGHWRSKGSYRIEHAQGEERFSAQFLPSRKHVRQALLTNRSAQLRIGFDVEGGLTNGLGTSIEKLVVHDRDGVWWELDGALNAGGETQLARLKDQAAVGRAMETLSTFNGDVRWDLPRGTYSARLASGVFNDVGGLDLAEIGGNHSLLGILDQEASR